MRLPRPRFTIRLMLALVAVAALALSVEATRRRMANLSLAYLGRARKYQSKADVASVSALAVARVGVDPTDARKARRHSPCARESKRLCHSSMQFR